MAPVRVRFALALLAAALLAPGALATYGQGSVIEGTAPILLAGHTDALATDGYASFISSDGRPSVSMALDAAELRVTFRQVRPCVAAQPGVPCVPPPEPEGEGEETTLHDARVTVRESAGAYKLVATNDPAAGFGAPGNLVASSNVGTLVGATTTSTYLSPYGPDWQTESPDALTDDIYEVGALESQLSARGGTILASHGFQVLLQGLAVDVTGTDEDGSEYRASFDTRSDDAAVRFVVLDVTGGQLAAQSAAPLQVFSASTMDVTGSAAIQDAKGTIREDGEETTYDGTRAVNLAGPVSLTLTGVTIEEKEDAPVRMAFAVSSNLAVLDALDRPAEKEDPLTLVAAGAAGASAAGLLAAIAYFWPRLKFASTLLFLPLYSRIERTSVLEHGKRDEIYELIRQQPGIHAHEIGERAQIGWGTTVYHLKLLEQHSLVVSKKSGRYKRFFVNTGEFTKKKDLYGALRNDTAKKVAEYIVAHPGCSQKDLCAALGIQPSLASWHVDKLEGVELVKRVKDGRQVRYFAGPAWEGVTLPTATQADADPSAAS